jgi:hypothetical protein
VSAACGSAWSATQQTVGLLVGDRCSAVPEVELSMAELASLRERTRAYRQDPGAPLDLSADELSWVVSEQYHTPSRFTVAGSQVTIERQLAFDGGCVDFSFTGQLEIHDGRVDARPKRLAIAGWTLPMGDHSKLELSVDDASEQDEELTRLIGAIDELEVRDEHFYVQLSDPMVLP